MTVAHVGMPGDETSSFGFSSLISSFPLPFPFRLRLLFVFWTSFLPSPGPPHRWTYRDIRPSNDGWG